MARPIWTGTLSFGLPHVPVSLLAGERNADLQFRMLDSRNNTPARCAPAPAHRWPRLYGGVN